MKSLFGCNSTTPVPREATRKFVLPCTKQENRILDSKKSQNIAILLRALNVTREEISEALLDGMYPFPLFQYLMLLNNQYCLDLTCTMQSAQASY